MFKVLVSSKKRPAALQYLCTKLLYKNTVAALSLYLANNFVLHFTTLPYMTTLWAKLTWNAASIYTFLEGISTGRDFLSWKYCPICWWTFWPNSRIQWASWPVEYKSGNSLLSVCHSVRLPNPPTIISFLGGCPCHHEPNQTSWPVESP